jgi:hypothetical protein
MMSTMVRMTFLLFFLREYRIFFPRTQFCEGEDQCQSLFVKKMGSAAWLLTAFDSEKQTFPYPIA